MCSGWLAHATLRLAKDREHAKELAYSSLALNPNSAIAMSMAGLTEAMSGNSEKALELLMRAQRMSPRDPRGWQTTATIALAHFVGGHFQEAASFANRALLHNPRYGAPLRVLAASLALLGQPDKAAEVLQRLHMVDPQLSLSTLRIRLAFMHDRVWNRSLKA